MNFVIPLWAGAMLGAGAMAVGALIAVELIVAVLTRPLSGVLADIRERTVVAAAGALIYGVFCALYAFSTNLPLAYLAAVVGGLTLLGYTDSFRTMFLLCAAACAVSAVLLAISPKMRADSSTAATLNAPGKVVGIARALRPMLIVVALTGLAESAIGILLLLRLQRRLRRQPGVGPRRCHDRRLVDSQWRRFRHGDAHRAGSSC